MSGRYPENPAIWLVRSKVVLKPFWQFKLLFNGKQTWKSLNRQNGFRTTLERLSCHKDFKITQAQTKVIFFYLNPLLQVEFRANFEPFSYILLNGSNVTQYCHVCKSQTTSGPPVVITVVKMLCNNLSYITKRALCFSYWARQQHTPMGK